MQNFFKILEFLSRFCSENGYIDTETKGSCKKEEGGVSPMWQMGKEKD